MYSAPCGRAPHSGTHDPVGGKGKRGLGQVVARGVARRKHGAVEHDERDLVGVV